VEFRVDKTGIIHVSIGKASFNEQALAENFDTLINAVVRAKPSSSKGQYLKSISLKTTMGPGINIDPAKAQAVVPA
jgi:large subunit ribosomal protein L1